MHMRSFSHLIDDEDMSFLQTKYTRDNDKMPKPVLLPKLFNI